MGQVNAATIDLVMRDGQFLLRSANVERVMRRLQDQMGAVAAAARRVLLVGGGAVAGFFALAAKHEMAGARIDAALAANGYSLNRYSASAKAAASAIQSLTTYDDDAVLSLMTLALNLGVTADQLEHATRMGLGLATALDQDATTGMRNFILAMNGEFTMLSRYLPALRTTNDETEKQRIVTDVAAKGFEQLTATSQTSWGRLSQLKELLGDLGETLGDVLLPKLDKWVKQLKAFVPLADDWVKSHESMLYTVGKWTAISAGSIVGLNLLISVYGTLSVSIKAVTTAFKFLTPYVAASGAAFLAASPIIAAEALTLLALAAAIDYALGREAQLNKELEESTAQSVEAAKAWERLRKGRETATAAGTDRNQQVRGVREQVEAWRELIQLQGESLALIEHLDDAERLLGQLEYRRPGERKRQTAELTEEELAHQKAVRETIAALEEKLAVYGMTENEMQLREARRKEATEAEIIRIQQLQNALDDRAAAEKRADDAHKARFDLLREEAQARADIRDALADEADMLAKQEAAKVKERLAAEAAARAAERENAARIEGLTDTWSRIMESAAGRRASEGVAATTPVSPAKTAAQMENMNKTAVESQFILSDIRALMQRLIDATPLAGAWG